MPATLEVSLGPQLTAEQAEQIYKQGKEAVVFALLEMAKKLAEQQSSPAPSTPSGMVAPYQKPSPKRRGKNKPGRKKGHPGARRKVPEYVHHEKAHRAKCCPECGGRLTRCNDTRTRYTEDIPDIEPEVTEHTIHRDWCENCRKRVEPKVPHALPGAALGNHVLVLSAWLHYALGNTLSQIVEVFNFHLQMKISSGGLVQMWYRLQELLFPWYTQIQKEALNSAVLHADETGWRVDGKTNWLWSFSTTQLTYFMIDRSRGSPALLKFFVEEFAGTLVSDFWGAYNAVNCALRQTCLVHLLRDLEQVEKYKSPGQPLGSIRQETAAIARGRHPLVAKTRRTASRDVCLASSSFDHSPAGIDREGLERSASRPTDQATSPSSKRFVYIPGQARGSL